MHRSFRIPRQGEGRRKLQAAKEADRMSDARRERPRKAVEG